MALGNMVPEPNTLSQAAPSRFRKSCETSRASPRQNPPPPRPLARKVLSTVYRRWTICRQEAVTSRAEGRRRSCTASRCAMHHHAICKCGRVEDVVRGWGSSPTLRELHGFEWTIMRWVLRQCSESLNASRHRTCARMCGLQQPFQKTQSAGISNTIDVNGER